MIKITKFLYIHMLIAPMIILSYYLGSLSTFLMSFGVVLVHELFHLIAALILGVDVKSIIILPFGMTLRLSKEVIRNPKKEIIIALSGPFANIVMLSLVRFFSQDINTAVFQAINWSVLILNLIPVPPLDGGRVLRAVFIKYTGLISAMGIVRIISKMFIVLIFVFGAGVVIYTQGNPSLMTIGAFLMYSMVEEKKNSDLLIMYELIGEKEKFKNKNLIPVRVICANYDTPAKAVIRKLNFSTFYIIHIVDKNRKIIKTATESDFIRAVKSKGYSVRAEEV